ncbi:hypothetical protein H0266_14400 [Halobacillus locisalis]|uniref:Uncharacterized protein n=1 Tax=Halobacillus locisalis TaxID=220753 RepID=A0A838CVX4_9BACI|nr:hypothetical protein [Halobacillus locisalis]MBA2176084.1 hypothetical protein [Halobacillus locisalis]
MRKRTYVYLYTCSGERLRVYGTDSEGCCFSSTSLNLLAFDEEKKRLLVQPARHHWLSPTQTWIPLSCLRGWQAVPKEALPVAIPPSHTQEKDEPEQMKKEKRNIHIKKDTFSQTSPQPNYEEVQHTKLSHPPIPSHNELYSQDDSPETTFEESLDVDDSEPRIILSIDSIKSFTILKDSDDPS